MVIFWKKITIRRWSGSPRHPSSGHCKSQHYLGCMYYMGQGVIRDFKKAIYWISKSTQNANVWEHNSIIKENNIILGRMYYHGYGVRVNYKKLLSCMRYLRLLIIIQRLKMLLEPCF